MTTETHLSTDRPRRSILQILVPTILILLTVVLVFLLMKRSNDRETSEFSTPDPLLGTVISDLKFKPLNQNQSVSLSKMGSKIILINFWATWCEACVTELPSLVALQKSYPLDQLRVLFVSLDESPDPTVQQEMERLGVPFPGFRDVQENAIQTFAVEGIPVTVALNSQRKVLMLETGEKNWNSPEFRNKIDRWISLEQ